MKKFLKFKRTESGTKLIKSKFISKKDREEINLFLEDEEYNTMAFKLGQIITIKKSFKTKLLKKSEIININKPNRMLIMDEAHAFLPQSAFANFFENTRGLNRNTTIITQRMDDFKK